MHTEHSAHDVLRSPEEARAPRHDEMNELRAELKALCEASRELRAQSCRVRAISVALRESLTPR
jgi:hypothetical protein